MNLPDKSIANYDEWITITKIRMNTASCKQCDGIIV